jgi:hypothetical protein
MLLIGLVLLHGYGSWVPNRFLQLSQLFVVSAICLAVSRFGHFVRAMCAAEFAAIFGFGLRSIELARS